MSAFLRELPYARAPLASSMIYGYASWTARERLVAFAYAGSEVSFTTMLRRSMRRAKRMKISAKT